MNSDERKTLQRCLKKTKELCQRRRRSEDWAQNLIEGSRGLTTPAQWKHFYVWLANPNKYDETVTDQMEIDNSLAKIDEYPEELEVNTFQNGPYDTIIHVKNPAFYKDVEEEKIES